MSNKQFTVPTGSAPGSGGGGGGSGTVTSVAMTGDGTVLNSSVTGSPVTTSGTLAPSLKTQTANTVLAGPTSGGVVAPTFRALVAGDLPAGTGTVTSVGLADSTNTFTVTGSPVTTAGTLTLSAFANQTANTVLAGPTSGGAAPASFRAPVAADIPNLPASKITSGTLAVAQGGTNLASGTDGGILGFTAAGTIASSGALTANRIVVGGGAGATPTVLASLGTTTTILHGNAAGAPTFGAVDLTADVTGVLPAANGGVAVSNAQGLGGQFVAADNGWGAINNSVAVVTAANIVDAYQFVQKYTQTFTRMAVRVTTTFGASSHVGVALYDSSGNRIANATTGALDGTSTGATQVVTVSSVTLTPGIYYVGVSTDGATTGRIYGLLYSVSAAAVTQFTNTARGNRFVTGNSASVGGVPPATLGTLSSNTTSTGTPLLWIEP